MAAVAVAIRIGAVRAGVLAVSLAGVCLTAAAQPHISLAQLGFRSGPNYTAVYAGQKVSVRGVVSAPSVHFQEFTLLAIQDGHNGGILRVPMTDASLDRYRPGDEVEAEGTVGVQYGMTVLEPEKIAVTAHKPPPEPKDLSVGELQGLMHLGELVRTQSPVVVRYRNAGGSGVFVSGPKDNYRIFVPRAPGKEYANFESIRLGGTVRVTGIALVLSRAALQYRI